VSPEPPQAKQKAAPGVTEGSLKGPFGTGGGSLTSNAEQQQTQPSSILTELRKLRDQQKQEAEEGKKDDDKKKKKKNRMASVIKKRRTSMWKKMTAVPLIVDKALAHLEANSKLIDQAAMDDHLSPIQEKWLKPLKEVIDRTSLPSTYLHPFTCSLTWLLAQMISSKPRKRPQFLVRPLLSLAILPANLTSILCVIGPLRSTRLVFTTQLHDLARNHKQHSLAEEEWYVASDELVFVKELHKWFERAERMFVVPVEMGEWVVDFSVFDLQTILAFVKYFLTEQPLIPNIIYEKLSASMGP